SAYQDGPAFIVDLLDLIRHRKIFFFLGAIDDVGIFHAQQRPVGGNDHDFQLVNLVELGGLGFGSSGHAGELAVHAEIILEGDGSQRLVFALDLDFFFGFDGLVQAIGPAAARHHAAGEIINNDDLAIFDYVLDIAVVERVGLDGGLHVMLEVPVLRVGDIADAQKALDLFPAFIGDQDILVLFIDRVLAGVGDFIKLANLFATGELGNDAVHALVLVGGFLAGAADDERGAGLVDEDGIHFVHDGVVMAALHAIFEVELHVVAQVVEAELVVGAVSDIGSVGAAALLVIEFVDDDADGEAEEGVELAHPLGVALGQVIVLRYHVHAAYRL